MNNRSNDTPLYGPDNPHPLSRMKTELVWEGKYDEYGNRRPVKLPSTPLPLQRIETIDEPRDREKAHVQMDLFDEAAFHQKAHRDDFRNMLIWGDNKLALAALLEQFRGQVDLIYIDPPFDVGADFTMQVQIGDAGEALEKEQSILEAVAYRDTWGKGAESYLHMMYERLTLMRDLLSDRGSLFLHVGTGMATYLSAIADEIFGRPNRRNQIVVKRVTKNLQRQFATIKSLPEAYDLIFWYTADPSASFAPLLTAQEPKHPEGYWKDFWSTADRPTMRYELLGITPSAGQWKWRQERAMQAVQNYTHYCHIAQPQGMSLFAYWQETGQKLEFIRRSPTDKIEHWVPPLESKFVDTVWMDFSAYAFSSGYNTEKSESLLARIIEHFTKPGDLVMDCFCGSGATLAVAEKLGRRWIGVDLGRYAIHTTRKRLIQVQRELHQSGQPYRSFDVYNLGRYERQWWQFDRLKGFDDEHRNLVLRFYKAAPLGSDLPPLAGGLRGVGAHPLLHGTRGGALVHIDQIDGIFTCDNLHTAAAAAQAVGARELHCLAWEFEMELALKKQAVEAETGLSIRLKYIPREIMEPNRTEAQFFEAGYLEARVITANGKVDVELVRFAPSLAEAPEKEMAALREQAISSPFDFIDFWAVDFTWREGKPFEHHWQDFRTRKNRSLKTRTETGWSYAEKGRHQICVKVIDVFGVDTTAVIEVHV
jgi:adenine-specific DNA-methyltransferase